MRSDLFPNNLVIFGTLYSGSSALVDLMNEFNGVRQVPSSLLRSQRGIPQFGEFDDFRVPGMIFDQVVEGVWHGRNAPSAVEVRLERLRACSSLNAEITYRFWSILMSRPRLLPAFLKTISSLRQQYSMLSKTNELLVAESNEIERVEIAQKWIESVFESRRSRGGLVFVDQGIHLDHDAQIVASVFQSAKFIVLVRNPVDQIADIIKSYHAHGSLRAARGNSPGGSLSFNMEILNTITAIERRLHKIEILGNALRDNQLSIINFDTFVDDYDSSLDRLIHSLGLKNENHKRKLQYFRPEESYKNRSDVNDLPKLISESAELRSLNISYNRLLDSGTFI